MEVVQPQSRADGAAIRDPTRTSTDYGLSWRIFTCPRDCGCRRSVEAERARVGVKARFEGAGARLGENVRSCKRIEATANSKSEQTSSFAKQTGAKQNVPRMSARRSRQAEILHEAVAEILNEAVGEFLCEHREHMSVC